MTEQEIIALLKSINTKVEALQSQMVMFQEALQPDLEYTKEKVEVTEEILMDLKNVMIMAQTPKAVLAVKKGYQKWVPLSCLNEGKYESGTVYDLMLLDTGQWIDKKPWETFKPQKEGK